MSYSFGNSYGKPFSGQYIPPQCDYNRVVMNFTVNSSGRQFDRLAVMYLDDTEIWRTSTAEPTLNGIVWTYMKDVSNYLVLWRQPQKIVFDLGNIIDQTYTGSFNATLTATFFTTPNVPKAADMIIPLSARRSANGSASSFMVPEVQAINTFSIPQNSKKAIFSLSAVGQADEEFWWSNVPNSTTATFVNNTLPGYSPFREVQLLVDGEVAGVAWPFPVIFTGGVVPGLWRPQVGIDAYDLKEDEIDLTPWLSLLTDGRDHTYEIRVMGLADDGRGNTVLTTVGNYWVVTGKLFLWLDVSNATRSGTSMTKMAPPPQFFITSMTTKASNGTNTTLTYQVLAQRQLSYSSTIQTSTGPVTASWQQTLQYSNIGSFTNNGNNQTNTQMTSGLDISSTGYSRKFSYPLYVMSNIENDPATNTMAISGVLDRSKNIQVQGVSVFPSGLESFPDTDVSDGYSLMTRQNGSSGLSQNPVLRTGTNYGITEQEYTFSGVKMGAAGAIAQVPFGTGTQPLFQRSVLAVNGSVARDSLQKVGEGPVGTKEGFVDQEFALMNGTGFVGGKFVHSI
ncbi:hypothetical protein FKW77_007034 [Venturia effusa]|uniref:Peptide N-acetyl-beta-D-glucosaminyl asparaginase amidase A N-terminal domain-containing protein n=1 Tax=Venturia effusa TaxID=50376 RepID=A0A517LLX5_9PEZI|nr:hypothetical protein FKW77_007034 [Venturia effusa]